SRLDRRDAVRDPDGPAAQRPRRGRRQRGADDHRPGDPGLDPRAGRPPRRPAGVRGVGRAAQEDGRPQGVSPRAEPALPAAAGGLASAAAGARPRGGRASWGAALDRRLPRLFPLPAQLAFLAILGFPVAYIGWVSLHEWPISPALPR